MKIAITGHTSGIGKSFADQLQQKGHLIVGLSRRQGENIRRTAHIANLIDPCDLFINNAQAGYAQVELLYELWAKWKGKKKYIWNISTIMTQEPINGTPDGQDDILMSAYRTQKLALEEASRQLRFKSKWPQISLIRPGGVATQDGFDNKNKCPVDLWTRSVIDIFCQHDKIYIEELSIGQTSHRIPI